MNGGAETIWRGNSGKSREKKNEVEEANGSGEIFTGGAVSGAAA